MTELEKILWQINHDLSTLAHYIEEGTMEDVKQWEKEMKARYHPTTVKVEDEVNN